MNMPVLEIVNLSELSGEEKYRLSYHRPIERLAKSIKELGPVLPLLCRKSADGLELFSGFCRKDAMLSLGENTCLALVFGENELSEENAFRISFFENALTRGLNLIERAIAVKILKRAGFNEKEIWQDYFQKANLNVGLAEIEKLDRLLGLDEEWKRYLVEREINTKFALALIGFSEQEREGLKFLVELGASASQFRELLTMLNEIGKRDKKAPQEIWKEFKLDKIRSNEKWNSVQKLNLIMDELKKIRYPNYSKLNNRHQRLCQSLKIPQEVKLEPIDYFETPQYELKMIIGLNSPVREIFEKILNMVRSPTWEKLFKLNDED